MNETLMVALRAVAAEHGKVPSAYEWREALRLARNFHDEGMETEEAARCAGTVAFALYGELPPWHGL